MRFICDDSGQDIIEYGLLASIIGIAGILVLPAIFERIEYSFIHWRAGVHEIYVPSDPVTP